MCRISLFSYAKGKKKTKYHTYLITRSRKDSLEFTHSCIQPCLVIIHQPRINIFIYLFNWFGLFHHEIILNGITFQPTRREKEQCCHQLNHGWKNWCTRIRCRHTQHLHSAIHVEFLTHEFVRKKKCIEFQRDVLNTMIKITIYIFIARLTSQTRIAWNQRA